MKIEYNLSVSEKAEINHLQELIAVQEKNYMSVLNKFSSQEEVEKIKLQIFNDAAIQRCKNRIAEILQMSTNLVVTVVAENEKEVLKSIATNQ
ncbi:hypothetical protein QTL86_03385 [Cellulosilyticum sp. ST5]|uniref:hypothetical protein n=1 Tax=Cellulosilyticum sp. ST5 TaxID=3055805 RepID=UPI0039775B17